MNKPTAAVKTARTITRGFVSAMKSGTRAVSPDHEGNCGRETGNAVVFMLNPLGGARCGLWREQTLVGVFLRSDVVQTRFSRAPPDGGQTALKGGMRRNAANAFRRASGERRQA
jgi:hypothetical protein